MARKIPRNPEKPKKPIRELFATAADAEKANNIAADELGGGVAVNYTDMPKNVGEMGDSGVLAHTPVISTGGRDKLRALLENPKHYELLGATANRICNETGASCRVLLDLTPEAGYFEVEHSE